MMGKARSDMIQDRAWHQGREVCYVGVRVDGHDHLRLVAQGTLIPALTRVTPSHAAEARAALGHEFAGGFQPSSMRLQGLAAILRLTSRQQEWCMTVTERSLVQVVRLAAGWTIGARTGKHLTIHPAH